MNGKQTKRLRKLSRIITSAMKDEWYQHDNTGEIIRPLKGIERLVRKKWCALNRDERLSLGQDLKRLSEDYLTERDMSLIMSQLNLDIPSKYPEHIVNTVTTRA